MGCTEIGFGCLKRETHVKLFFTMSRYDEFETKLEALMNEFADLDYEDMADALEYESERARNMSNRRG